MRKNKNLIVTEFNSHTLDERHRILTCRIIAVLFLPVVFTGASLVYLKFLRDVK